VYILLGADRSKALAAKAAIAPPVHVSPAE
jgi:hypothetical protein